MECQLCLLRQSNAYPHISSNTHLYSHHDYNAHPFVLLGMEALVHDKPHRRNLLPNTAPKGTSSAHPTSTTAAGKYGHQLCAPPASLPQSSSNTITPADAIIATAANLSHLLTNNLQAHHNNKVNQTDSPDYKSSHNHHLPLNTMQHIINNTHQKQHTRPHQQQFPTMIATPVTVTANQ
eukprot:CCRYP_016807-RA/>CCRYP_016807-RA protein AED:0.58 eAED:0.41 QI:0/0/0/1/0/0/2/0/178